MWSLTCNWLILMVCLLTIKSSTMQPISVMPHFHLPHFQRPRKQHCNRSVGCRTWERDLPANARTAPMTPAESYQRRPDALRKKRIKILGREEGRTWPRTTLKSKITTWISRIYHEKCIVTTPGGAWYENITIISSNIIIFIFISLFCSCCLSYI